MTEPARDLRLGARGHSRALVAAVVAVSCGWLWVAWQYQRPPPAPEPPLPGLVADAQGVTLAAGAPAWSSLRLGTAHAGRLRQTDPVPARIQLDETRLSRVGAPLAGRVSAVFVERGARVKAGAPLFAISSPALAELRTERAKAELDLGAARTNLERVSALVAAHALPAKEQLAAEREARQADLEVALAESKLAAVRAAGGGASELVVRSPRDGVVLEKNCAIAQQVSPDAPEPFFVVADLSTVWVVADLFPEQAAAVQEGAPAEVTTPSLPGAVLAGTVEQVSAVVDPLRHTVPVRVRLANPQRALRPNLYASVRFQAAPAPGEVEVAASAVLTDGEHSYVYAEGGQGRFQKRTVLAGPVHEGRVSILDGSLRPGEAVVEEGAILLDNQISLSN